MTTAPSDRAVSQQELAGYATSRTTIGALAPTAVTRFQFFAAFDGTWNDRGNLGLSKTNHETNVATMERLVKLQDPDQERTVTEYYKGVGTNGVASQSGAASVLPDQEVVATAEKAYA